VLGFHFAEGAVPPGPDAGADSGDPADTLATFLCPCRKAGKGGQRLQARGDLAQIDFRLEEGDLVVDCRLADVDVPGPGPAVAAVAPAVASTFQDVLQIERRLLGPDPYRLPARLLQQQRKRRRACGRQFDREDFQKSVAVVDGSVRKKPAPFRR
jgi:hypothetical protein